jgi:hypothetical protein
MMGWSTLPFMYKIIMNLATINSVTTTQTLRNNLQLLGMFAATVSGAIDKLHNKFDKIYSQMIARRATVDDPIGILFDAYLVVPCHNFKSYICLRHKDYLNEKLTAITHRTLTTSAKHRFNQLKTKGTWGAKSPNNNNEKIVAMTATLNALKGHLKLDSKLSAIANDGKMGRRKTRRTHSINVNKRRMRHGRKSCQRVVKRRRSKSANTLTTGASTTWRGLPTNLSTAC